ncbi:MAG: 2-C-methyl-D-erythritol 4-phosphate cytidylyltransferase [Gammaproteobacteria bacterium]|nr:2-C-methyl-D-erythritol 4-phosphate cytidylyltransferase [Gammaproteobacteria bacterium]MBU0893405.1 2-C-methyl-D-erythritol 4-phosphate cytidylyltransferase [Gammaproteobacteria bacterium]MBU1352680.1 2-C-methyl-D-erythritol 4-phosphate cytidylyltransferase [Gammaproteobacteria bacterium]MBU1505478.1 2-C-methyl-D-erythritol 4-phosphate cytidylyltransferase [Gammaproteobacteria bacterium]MBU1819252.1 2-C-methyl-D-erythritol 4-phosphate cytidylyltransferase [Gammaproteobacteria bacterium]
MTAPLLQPPLAPLSAHGRFWALVPCAGIGSRAIAAGVAAHPVAGGSTSSAAACGDSSSVSTLAAFSAADVALSMPAGPLPKQYHPVAGHPMVLHTLGAFAGVGRLLGTLVAVAPGDHFLDAHAHATFFVVECGGPTRGDTVLGGLKALLARGAQPDDWVLVHDAARCLITSEQIDTLIDQCAGDSVGGLLAHKLADTLKTSIDGPGGVRVASTVDRSNKWLAQTPQMFRIGPLMDAIEKVGSNVTDEASAMEAMGLHPRLVPGGAQNFKVTYPDDFALAAAVLAQRGYGTTLARFGGERGQVTVAPGKKNLF